MTTSSTHDTDTVLLVDDNDGSREAIGLLLRAAGFVVLETDNGEDALCLMRLDPDLVVLDVCLPDIYGYEVCRRIRAEPATAQTPVLMVSGHAIDCDGRVKGLEAGADAYLAKPVEPNELVAYAKALLRVRHAEDALRDSERRLRGLMEKSLDAVLLISQDGIITYASPSSARALGYPMDQLAGLNSFDLIHPDDRSEVDELFVRLLDAPARTAAVTFRARHHSGSWHWLEALYTNRLGKVGVDAVMCNFRDVTTQRRSNDQSQQEQRLQAVGRMAGGVAHDFNNLLTIINGYAELLREALPAGERAHELATEVNLAGERAASLTRQLLDFTQPQPPDPQPTNLNAVVNGMEKMLRRIVGENIEITTDLEPNLLSIVADPTQIEQVLLNLAVNARDAMPQGGHLSIETRTTFADPGTEGDDCQSRPQVVLAVQDNGVGMTADVKARIFEPFFTTKLRGQGTGLGLVTVFDIIERTAGCLNIDTAPGLGTTFRIVFPATLEMPLAVKFEPDDRPQRVGTETILLVEDDTAICDLAGRLLQERGYTVLEAHNGADALALLGHYHGKIHLLIVDVVMPWMGGRELAEKVCAMRREAKILFISGYPSDELGRYNIRMDDVNFLRKPFTPIQLNCKVRQLLDAHEEVLPPNGSQARHDSRMSNCSDQSCTSAPTEDPVFDSLETLMAVEAGV
jgi:two-component system cell cycle sensor histidine kinase/response regulator CckA